MVAICSLWSDSPVSPGDFWISSPRVRYACMGFWRGQILTPYGPQILTHGMKLKNRSERPDHLTISYKSLPHMTLSTSMRAGDFTSCLQNLRRLYLVVCRKKRTTVIGFIHTSFIASAKWMTERRCRYNDGLTGETVSFHMQEVKSIAGCRLQIWHYGHVW